MRSMLFGESYPLSQPHDEDIIDRRRTIEESHPAYIKYNQAVQDAWMVYQNVLDMARNIRELELPHDELIEMIQGRRKMKWEDKK